MGQSNILQAFQFNFSLFLVVSCGGRFFFLCVCVSFCQVILQFSSHKKKAIKPKDAVYYIPLSSSYKANKPEGKFIDCQHS